MEKFITLYRAKCENCQACAPLDRAGSVTKKLARAFAINSGWFYRRSVTVNNARILLCPACHKKLKNAGNIEVRKQRARLLDTPQEIDAVCHLYYDTENKMADIARSMRVSSGTIERVLKEHGAKYYQKHYPEGRVQP